MAAISRNYLASVEKGANVSISVLGRIARALEIGELPLGATSGVLMLKTPSEKPDTAFNQRDQRIIFPLREDPAGLSVEQVSKVVDVAHAIVETDPEIALSLIMSAAKLASHRALPADKEDQQTLLGATLKECANAFVRLGRYKEALRALSEAETALSPHKSTQLRLADVRYVRAHALFDMRRYSEALQSIELAQSAFREGGDQIHLVNAHMLKGGILFRLGRTKEALRTYRHVASLARRVGDHYRLSLSFNALATMYSELGDLAAAEKYVLDALSLRLPKGSFLAVFPRWNLARIEVRKSNFEQALTSLYRVRDELLLLGNATAAGGVTLDIAETLILLGRPEKVPQVSAGLVRLFADQGMDAAAMEAISLVREATAARKPSPKQIRAARAKLQSSSQHVHLVEYP